MRMHTIGLGGLAAGVVMLGGLSVGAAMQDTGSGSTLKARTTPTAPAAGKAYDVDGTHSSVIFRVSHLGTAPFYGRFNEMSGSFTSGDNPTFEITVPTASIDSNSDGRDNHLKSPEFFSAKEFPAITFVSTKTTKVAAKKFKVNGNLTLRGTTRPIVATIEQHGEGDTPMGARAGYHAVFTIKRADFGMTYGIEQGMLGDDVTIMIGLEGTLKK